MSVPFTVDGEYVVPRRIPYGQLRVEVPDTAIAPVNLGTAVNVQAVALGEHSHQKVSGPIESLVDVRDQGTLVSVRDHGATATGGMPGGMVSDGVRYARPVEDRPELLDTSPAARPFAWPGRNEAELMEAVRALTQEVGALREWLRNADTCTARSVAADAASRCGLIS